MNVHPTNSAGEPAFSTPAAGRTLNPYCLDLNIAAGRATLVWNTSPGAFQSTEPVS